MTYRKVNLVPGEYFHVYNRGNSKQKIFLDDEDRDRFIKLMYLSNSKQNINFRDQIVKPKIDALSFKKGDNIVFIGAWVLMPNHFHIYIISPDPGSESVGDETEIAMFMRKLCGSYVKYFNNKYKRTGYLFEGRYKAVHVSEEIQAKYLFSYIHLNPIKLIQKDWKEAGIKDKDGALNFLFDYKYSSYLDYMGIKRKENILLNREYFPEYFKEEGKFQQEIFEWLTYNIPAHPEPGSGSG